MIQVYFNAECSGESNSPLCTVISGSGSGSGNYIYAQVGLPGSGPAPPGESIVIRGAERTTPAVARFGDLGKGNSVLEI